jgi:alkylation response protein AidB-like acyl-CoA dehydrogenase
MALVLTDEQHLLNESLQRFIEKDYTFEVREGLRRSDTGFGADNWQQFADLGWLAVAIPETYGGLDGAMVEQTLVCEQFGRAMVLEPYVSTTVMAAAAIVRSGDEATKATALQGIAEGRKRFALAFSERNARYDLHHVESTATKSGSEFRIRGEKIAVLDLPSADSIVVAARLSGGVRDADGIGLFLVDATASGLSTKTYSMMDGSRAGELTFDNTPAQLLVDGELGLEALSAAVEDGIIARSAQATGAMAASFEQTLEYVKTRKQFGVPIGSFQTLQHRLVDMWMVVRECQAMVMMSAQELTTNEPKERAMAASATKSFVGKRARQVAQEIVQMHGGIGMTEELPIGHYFRHLTLYSTLFGSADYHLNRYAALCRS